MSLALAGCTVGPDYKPPQMDVPAHFTEQDKADQARAAQPLTDWWRRFRDPLLDRLVAQAIAGNYDLREARQRLIASREARRVAAAAAYPQVNFGGTAQNDRASQTLQYPPNIGGVYRLYQFGFDASWELDVFGGTRRAVEAAEADTGASVEDRRVVLVSLLAELVADYASLRTAQLRLSIAARNVKAARAALGLTQKSFTQGLGTDLDVAQARAQLETVQSAEPPLRAEVARQAHAIALLLGDFPGALEKELSRPRPLIPVPPRLPRAIPSEVVANRPDILRAERRFAAANARIGVAVAQLYPHFTIPISLQPASSFLHELFSAASLTWMLGLSATESLYDGGRRHAQVRRARAEAEDARLDYEHTVMAAFRDVEDALVNDATERQRHTTLAAAARDNALALERARRLYQAGLTDFLKVLDSERATFAAEDALAQSSEAQVQDTIALYKALGGGWRAVPLPD